MKKKSKSYSRDDLIFLPLGGAGEIGMNCNLYYHDNEWLMIDLGITFNDEKIKSADVFMPNIDFIIKRRDNLSGIILTHAHEDHIGAMPYLYKFLGNCPIYTTPFTSSVLKRKFEGSSVLENKINILEYNKRIKIGKFDIEIIGLTHSIPEPNAVVIRNKKANIFHTGDWKIDPQPIVGKMIDDEKIIKLGKEGIDVMICDSTNVFNEKTSGSEIDVRDAFEEVFSKRNEGKIIITCFASNVARLDTIAHTAKLFGRTCVLVGRSLKKIYESALENNYLKNFDTFLTEEGSKSIHDDNLVLICTGSQGESRAALYKLVFGKNRYFTVNDNDLVIFSSREIPGNEKQIKNIKNELMRMKCKFLDDNHELVHVSGHPSKRELKQMYDWVKPDKLIPVHGEYQHLLEHKRFAKESGINESFLIENGDVISIERGKKLKKVDNIDVNRKVLMGNRVLPIEKKIFHNTKLINEVGELLIVIVLNMQNTFVVRPEVLSLTIFDEDDFLEKEKLIKFIETKTKEIIKNFINDQMMIDILKKNIKKKNKK